MSAVPRGARGLHPLRCRLHPSADVPLLRGLVLLTAAALRRRFLLCRGSGVCGALAFAGNWWCFVAPRLLDYVLLSFAIDVRMLEAAKAWLAQHAPAALLFTWTVRTAKERAAAARWADAPIFEVAERAGAAAMS